MSESAKSWFAEKGFSLEYGARPLKRLLQTEIQDKVADMILCGDIKDGASLQVNANGDEIHISASVNRKKMH